MYFIELQGSERGRWDIIYFHQEMKDLNNLETFAHKIIR